MAARETGIGAVETFMHAGKLLALDLLVKILENKAHNWGNVRQEVSWMSTFGKRICGINLQPVLLHRLGSAIA